MAAKKADAAFRQVTHKQGLGIAVMANQMGVSHDQFQEGTRAIIPTAFRAMKQTGARLKLIPPIAPPSWGGRVYEVKVPVILGQPWQEAVNEAGPDTPYGYNVWKVGKLYPPTGTGIKEADVVLVSLTGGGDFAKAVAWAEQYDLKRTPPRHVFAIGRHKPNLHRELRMNPMYVVATQECSFEGYQRVCDVWFDGAEREADLRWVDDVSGFLVWVAFSRE